jgi:hypothetical protein
MSEENSKDNERENDKKPQGVLSEGFVGSNPTPRTFYKNHSSYQLRHNKVLEY